MTLLVSILTLCLFDCLAEGITTLFVFSHVSSRLAMIKSGGSRFQFCGNAAVNSPLLVREGFNSHSGYNISNAFPNKTIFKHGMRLGRPAYSNQVINEAVYGSVLNQEINEAVYYYVLN